MTLVLSFFFKGPNYRWQKKTKQERLFHVWPSRVIVLTRLFVNCNARIERVYQPPDSIYLLSLPLRRQRDATPATPRGPRLCWTRRVVRIAPDKCRPLLSLTPQRCPARSGGRRRRPAPRHANFNTINANVLHKIKILNTNSRLLFRNNVSEITKNKQQ